MWVERKLLDWNFASHGLALQVTVKHKINVHDHMKLQLTQLDPVLSPCITVWTHNRDSIVMVSKM